MRNVIRPGRLVACLLMVLVQGTQAAGMKGVQVDMQSTAHEAVNRGLPIMVVFINDDCEYCDVVRDEVIRPMQISGDYKDKVIMRVINLDAAATRNFSGEVIGAESFAGRYRIELTPTVVLNDATGKVLAAAIAGISNLDYYSSLLDDAIDAALYRLRGKK